MKKIYTSPKFRIVGDSNTEYSSFVDASRKNGSGSIDYTTVLSALCLGQAPANRTVLKEISTNSWVSEISRDVQAGLLTLHGGRRLSVEDMALAFIDEIKTEIREICLENTKINLLLTGGLDSRLYAGVLNDLISNEGLDCEVLTYTWGSVESRDVVYAQKISAIYGWEWTHIPLTSRNVIENISVATDLGLLHSPEMLHSMPRLEDFVDNDGAIVAVSFGDSIGRGEFSNLHLLELQDKRKAIVNPMGLFSEDAFSEHKNILEKDISMLYTLNDSVMNLPQYVKNELWMQGFRMRNGLCHAMTVFNGSGLKYYQGMTSYNVVNFIWSLHPSYRGDKMYEYILSKVYKETLSIPWARNNRLINGDRVRNDYKPSYHNYTLWSANELFEYTESLVMSSEITNSGHFDNEALKLLRDKVAKSTVRIGRINDIWLYISSLSLAIQRFSDPPKYNFEYSRTFKDTLENKGRAENSLEVIESRSKVIIVDTLKMIRSQYRVLRREIIKKYWKIKF